MVCFCDSFPILCLSFLEEKAFDTGTITNKVLARKQFYIRYAEMINIPICHSTIFYPLRGICCRHLTIVENSYPYKPGYLLKVIPLVIWR